MILKAHKGIPLETNVNTKRSYPTSRMVSSLMNMPVQPNKAIVGKNAFAHSSGIHQDGVLKNAGTYEIIDPSDVGVDTNSIVLTARSGRAALKYRLEVNGVKLDDEKMDKVYEAFLRLADSKKEIHDDDILMLAGADRAAAAGNERHRDETRCFHRTGHRRGEVRGCRDWKRTCGCCYQRPPSDRPSADDHQ